MIIWRPPCRKADPAFPTLILFDARATGQLSIPERSDQITQIGSVSLRDPDTVTLRHNRLWLVVPDDDLRRQVFDLYGITDPADRARVGGSATALEDDAPQASGEEAPPAVRE